MITKVAKNGFHDYMKSIGKLGGQNKTPRLSNDRGIVDLLNKKKHKPLWIYVFWQNKNS